MSGQEVDGLWYDGIRVIQIGNVLKTEFIQIARCPQKRSIWQTLLVARLTSNIYPSNYTANKNGRLFNHVIAQLSNSSMMGCILCFAFMRVKSAMKQHKEKLLVFNWIYFQNARVEF